MMHIQRPLCDEGSAAHAPHWATSTLSRIAQPVQLQSTSTPPLPSWQADEWNFVQSRLGDARLQVSE